MGFIACCSVAANRVMLIISTYSPRTEYKDMCILILFGSINNYNDNYDDNTNYDLAIVNLIR